MALFACGINHKTAPLALRETFALEGSGLEQAYKGLCDTHEVRELVILSTCNRTEMYFEAETVAPSRQWFFSRGQAEACFGAHFYQYQDTEALQHILRVAGGLDSMVLGEPQILGQMKAAFAVAKQLGAVKQQLSHLFQYVFSVTKAVRTQTAIGESPVSVASLAVDLAKRIFSHLGEAHVFFLGAGETTELALQHMFAQGVRKIFVFNRTQVRGEQIANKFGGVCYPFSELPLHLHQADILLTATASQLPIVGKGAVEEAMRLRKNRPMFLVDLAVPRDIESQVAEVPGVYLYTLDDLQSLTAQNVSGRLAAAQDAEDIISSKVTDYLTLLREQRASATIRAFRQKVMEIEETLYAASLRAIESGEPPALVLKRYGKLLTKRLLHQPSVMFRDIAVKEQTEMLDMAQKLFALEDVD